MPTRPLVRVCPLAPPICTGRSHLAQARISIPLSVSGPLRPGSVEARLASRARGGAGRRGPSPRLVCENVLVRTAARAFAPRDQEIPAPGRVSPFSAKREDTDACAMAKRASEKSKTTSTALRSSSRANQREIRTENCWSTSWHSTRTCSGYPCQDAEVEASSPPAPHLRAVQRPPDASLGRPLFCSFRWSDLRIATETSFDI